MFKPIIGIPIGDPAGIGPEIALKAIADSDVLEYSRPVLIGDAGVLRQAAAFSKLSVALHMVKDPAEGFYRRGCADAVDLADVDLPSLKMGRVQSMGGKAAFDYIKKSVELALAGKIDAVATTPINKESLHAAGVPYIGHTEIFGGLTNTYDPLTMFEVRNMRIFFLSRHLSLRKACDAVTKERVLEYIERCTKALKQLGVAQGKMAVAGLNPHCGEHGLFGDEEEREIRPAVEEARRRGYQVEGPVGADSVFHLCLKGMFNSVLSLYHDQGHIAAKTLDFEKTISFTLGLPFLRTSVDHGTAFDLAGKGTASAVSMVEAIRLAAKYCGSYNASR